MTSLLDKTNLRPNEKRLVVGIGLVIFFVLNLVLVWPHFGDWGKLKKKKMQMEDDLARFQREVDRIPAYQKQLAELQKQGAVLASEDQALNLSKTVYSQAALSGMPNPSYTPAASRGGGGRTNQFFEEESGTLTVTTEEKPFVTFLTNLGTGDSLIRVRSMNLSPDPTRMKLVGSVTLVASYQKKQPVKPAAAPATRAGAPKTNVTAAGKGTNAPSKASPFTRTNAPPRSTNPPAPKK